MTADPTATSAPQHRHEVPLPKVPAGVLVGRPDLSEDEVRRAIAERLAFLSLIHI